MGVPLALLAADTAGGKKCVIVVCDGLGFILWHERVAV